MSRIREILEQLTESLDSITLKELTNDVQLQRDLRAIGIVITDFLNMLNPRNKPLILNFKNGK
jgi:hypothetical protein